MSIILNLGMSRMSFPPLLVVAELKLLWIENWQKVDITTMQFPAEMLIDYVRVYQRKGATNVGCNPPDYPTADYINNHKDAYESKLFAATSAVLYGGANGIDRCEYDDMELGETEEQFGALVSSRRQACDLMNLLSFSMMGVDDAGLSSSTYTYSFRFLLIACSRSKNLG